jgi:REP element-mobilizing transposase RayT
MVIASHAVFAAYGFWPPNDQRGSWSDHVWAEHLKPFGEPNKVSTRKSLAHVRHDRAVNSAIREAMKYPPVQFNGEQRLAIVEGIAEVVSLLKVRLYACAVLPDHVHIVPARHSESVESLIGFFKRAATRRLTARGIHPMRNEIRKDGAAVTPWVRGGWKRFLNVEADIPGACDYVWTNFARSGIPAELYPFVVPFGT